MHVPLHLIPIQRDDVWRYTTSQLANLDLREGPMTALRRVCYSSTKRYLFTKTLLDRQKAASEASLLSLNLEMRRQDFAQRQENEHLRNAITRMQTQINNLNSIINESQN